MKQFQNVVTPLLFLGFVLSSMFLNPREQKQVYFLPCFAILTPLEI